MSDLAHLISQQDVFKETPVCSRRHSALLTLTSPISEACFNYLLFILELDFIASVVYLMENKTLALLY